MKTHPIAEQARQLLRQHLFADAKQILQQAFTGSDPHPDLWCEYLICECYYGNETAAAAQIEKAKGGVRFSELRLILSRYFFCTEQFAPTAASKAWFRKFPYQPEAGIGTRISACLIVKNEEAKLERCLQSLTGIVDEIIVVDTGSTDSTVLIAERFGARIGHFAWINDFSAARNHALSLASGEWALWIDADETLDPACKDAFRSGVIRSHIGGYSIQIVNYLDDGGTTTEFVHCPTRLFRNLPGVQFSEAIHEQITPSLLALGLPWTPLEGALIHHDGYRDESLSEKNKIDRTLTILKEVIAQNPNEPFQRFNLANTYFVAGEYELAAKEAEITAEMMVPAGAEYGPSVYQVWATSLDHLGKHQQALEVCEKCDRTAYHTVVNEYLRATALLNLGEYARALESIEIALNMDWNPNQIGDKGIHDFRKFGLRAQILGCLGRWEEALAGFEDALRRQPGFSASYLGKAMALEALGRDGEAEDAYRQALSDPQTGSPAAFGLAQIAERRGDTGAATEWFGEAWNRCPDRLDLFDRWVGLLESSGQTDLVLRAYAALDAKTEIGVSALINWAHALEQAGDIGEAMKKLLHANQLAPEDANVLFTFGDLLYRNRQFEHAITMYESALRMNSDHADGWFVLGNSLAQLGHDAAAIRCYDQAVVLDPGHQRARANRDTLSAA